MTVQNLHRFEDGICTNCDAWLEEKDGVPCTVQQHGEFILYFRDQGAAHRWAFELEHRLHEGVEAWPTLQKLAWRDMAQPPYLPEKGEAPHDLMVPPGLMAYWLKRKHLFPSLQARVDFHLSQQRRQLLALLN